MNIGQAAERSGLPTKTIRYYEDVGLLQPARRANGFRDYGDRDVHDLRFIARARGLASASSSAATCSTSIATGAAPAPRSARSPQIISR